MTQPIRYSIVPKDLAAHLFEVSVTVHPAERFSVSMRLKRSQG